MDKKGVFVKTKDYDTAATLRKEGFEEVDYSAGVWTFLQCTEKYEEIEGKVNEKNVYFSNILNV